MQAFNSLATKKQTTKFSSANFEKKKNVKSKLHHIENSKTRGQGVDLDEVAHYEPLYQDLRCLQIQLFSSLVLKGLRIWSLAASVVNN